MDSKKKMETVIGVRLHWAKGCGQPLEPEKGKEMEYTLEPLDWA